MGLLVGQFQKGRDRRGCDGMGLLVGQFQEGRDRRRCDGMGLLVGFVAYSFFKPKNSAIEFSRKVLRAVDVMTIAGPELLRTTAKYEPLLIS